LPFDEPRDLWVWLAADLACERDLLTFFDLEQQRTGNILDSDKHELDYHKLKPHYVYVTTLSGVSYESVTSSFTPDSVVTYLFHDQ